jgi:signal transduction histidine kinase
LKLLHRTHILTALWLLPVMFIGGIFVYYMIRYVTHEEADESLAYNMQHLLKYYEVNNNLPDFHKIDDILTGIKVDEPVYRDTLLYEISENEFVPYRELNFSIEHDGDDFTIVLRQRLPEREELAISTLLIIIGLAGLIYIIMFWVINRVARKIWNPFYLTLEQLTLFKIEEPVPTFSSTRIAEFNNLNNTLKVLLRKISDDYRNNKEFNENVSHEIQTHLAIVRAGAEKLLNTTFDKGNKEFIEELRKIYVSVTQLSQTQKSLLTLSRINNREFHRSVNVNVRELVEESIGIFSEVMEVREISLKSTIQDCYLKMDPGLIKILIDNLVKNAVKHNINGGYVNLGLSSCKLEIENSGLRLGKDPDGMFKRFIKGEHGNSGIGLSIVRQICELYDFSLNYEVSPYNDHKITIHFTKS